MLYIRIHQNALQREKEKKKKKAGFKWRDIFIDTTTIPNKFPRLDCGTIAHFWASQQELTWH